MLLFKVHNLALHSGLGTVPKVPLDPCRVSLEACLLILGSGLCFVMLLSTFRTKASEGLGLNHGTVFGFDGSPTPTRPLTFIGFPLVAVNERADP